ncbi:MAG: cob(I)yrinic acid a,c-diamide adenosyltransferase [Candidatus Marinimicrobia bacterium]|nr:cob(I)yrinic acid a,c-diamide adenosyltransferase [Candidatus Neomarinimicrobiota bacterium]
MKGYVQVYTGNGKGKTTAAIGLAIRAAGAGKKVYIAQFVKGMRYSEIKALERFDEITVEQFGLECFIVKKPKQEDIDAALYGLKKVKEVIVSGQYDIIILDEANIAVFFKLFSVDDLMSIIDLKPDNVELVITGRYAEEKLIQRADLVTEMKEIRHYYQSGVEARPGIES